MSDPDPMLKLEGVSFAYPDGRSVLTDANLELFPQERLALLGANGAGKSTLFSVILGLHGPAGGRIEVLGKPCRTEKEFRAVRPKVGLLFQDSDDQLFCPTVAEDVAFGPRNLGHGPEAAREMAEAALARVGLTGFGDRVPHRLSGGEKRLVALAGLLAMEPDALLLDEPTGGLDTRAQAMVLDLLTGLPQAMIIVSHDRSVIARLAERTVVLADGRIGASGALPLFVPPDTHGASW